MFRRKKTQYTYGMQILDKEVKMVEILNSPQMITVTQRHSFPLESGSVKNGKLVDENSVVSRIEQKVKQLGLEGAKVNLTVPMFNVIMRKSVFPSLKDKELRNLIDVEIHGNSQLPFKNPVFDYIRLGPVEDEAAAAGNGKHRKGSASPKEEVLIFATPLDIVDSYARVAKLAGLEPVAVDLPPLSLFRLLVRHFKLTGERPANRFMFLQIEADYADASIFIEGTPVFFRSIQNTANYLLDAGNDPVAAYGRNLSIELGRLLNYFKYSVSTAQEEIEEIYLVGESRYIQELPGHLEGTFQGTIRPIPLEAVLQSADASNYAYAVPLGLAMKGA